MNTIPPRIYNNLYEVRENIITAFQPIIIKKPKCDKDTFSKNFGSITPPKRNFLYKFANLSEHHKLLYNLFDLKILQNFSKEKLKSLFLIASAKDSMGMLRFSPSELLKTATLPDETLNFIKPFARQKKSTGIFNYSFENLKSLTEFSPQERQNAMQLFAFKLLPQDLINLCKDKNVNIQKLKHHLSVIDQLYPQKISEIGIKKYKNNYIISVFTEDDFKNFHYVFDNKLNPDNHYKSNIDFETGQFRKNNLLNKFKILFNKKSQNNLSYIENNNDIPVNSNFTALGNIIERAEYLKSMQQKIYQENFVTTLTKEGHLINTTIKFPKNMLVQNWQKGFLSKSDLMRICSDYAEFIPQADFNYFALNKIPITPFDDEKILEIRKNNILAAPVQIGSTYYKKVLENILQTEDAKLKNIKAEKKMIIIDGLPGAGKSTIIHRLLKKDNNAFYTPDSDEIKAMFKEVYKNGEYSNLVHKAAGNILKNEIIPQVLSQGKNLIYQTTGDFISINKIITQAAEHGYKIDFIQIPTPKNLSLERSIKRFNSNGRFMDPITTMSIFNHNNKEKLYSAKIFSYNPNISDTYIFEHDNLKLIKNGLYTGEGKNL